MRKLLSGTAGPTILVSLALFALCALAAGYIYHQQSTTAYLLGENLDSRRAVHDLETTLNDLLAQLRRGSQEVEGLHDRIREQLLKVKDLADLEEEKIHAEKLEQLYAEYLSLWSTERNDQRRVPAIEAMLAESRRLHQFDSLKIEEAEETHGNTVRLMAWGLFGVGTLASMAGILLGVAVTRSFRRSIHLLSIRVQAATHVLGQNMPPVTISQPGDLDQVHDQMQTLLHAVEETVRRLQEREREVLRAEQLAAVGQLASGAAHELRNPLTAIKMLIQTMREEADERQLPLEDLEVLGQEVVRMERCLQGFLDFARPPKMNLGHCDLVQVVDKTVALVASRARNQRVELAFQRPDNPVVLEADADQLQQLLVNLVLNALDAMPSGGQLDLALSGRAREHVELRVSDTGQGIPEELLPRLFEPFVSSKETGLGLGLVVSRRIAEAHQGTLSAENRPGGGASFTLQLPTRSQCACA